jgi:hypothetical protein
MIKGLIDISSTEVDRIIERLIQPGKLLAVTRAYFETDDTLI